MHAEGLVETVELVMAGKPWTAVPLAHALQ